MIKSRRRWFRATLLSVLALPAVGLGCSQAEPEEATGDIPSGAFALVGDQALPTSLLDWVASPDAARGVVHDELFRQGALQRSLPGADAVERGVLARGLLEKLRDQVRREQPITEADLLNEKKRRWVQFDRPRAVRGAEIFIAVPPLGDSEAAYQRAEKIHRAVSEVKNPQHFVDRGRAAAGEEKVSLSVLSPVAEDGTVVPLEPGDERSEPYPVELAQAASQLENPGDMTGVVGTKFGFHILFALEIIEEHRPPLSEITPELTNLILSERVDALLEKLNLSAKTPVSRVRDDIATLLRQTERDK